MKQTREQWEVLNWLIKFVTSGSGWYAVTTVVFLQHTHVVCHRRCSALFWSTCLRPELLKPTNNWHTPTGTPSSFCCYRCTSALILHSTVKKRLFTDQINRKRWMRLSVKYHRLLCVIQMLILAPDIIRIHHGREITANKFKYTNSGFNSI